MNQPYSRAALLTNTKQFLSGKLISALLTISILLLLVRVLPVAEYGVYVTLVAIMEVGLALSQMGLYWLTARYLPEYRIKASGSQLINFCLRVLCWQAFALILFAALFALLMDAYLQWLGLQAYSNIGWIFLGILLLEGLARFLRDGLLGPLMLQSGVRASMVLRQSFLLVGIVVSAQMSAVSLAMIAMLELMASALGALIAGAACLRFFAGVRSQQGEGGWQEIDRSQQWKTAFEMYLAHVLTITYSPQVLINLVQKTLGPEAAALFGFLRTLNDQISRYLPATLLFSLIRPKLVANYVASGDVEELGRMTNAAGKISLLVLLPMIAVVATFGDAILLILSGGKFVDTGFLLCGFLLLLIPFSQRQLIETLALTLNQASLCKWGALLGVLVLPCLWVLMLFDLGIWAVVVATGVGYLLFNVFVIAGIRVKTQYALELNGQTKMFAALLAATSSGILVTHLPVSASSDSLFTMLGFSLLIVVVYGLATLLMNPFTAQEQARLRSLIARGGL